MGAMAPGSPRRGLRAWISDRTGLDRLVEFARQQLLKPVPKKLSWAYTLGGLALFFFAVQFGTGFLLLVRYAASPEVAYKSVQAIQHRAHLGWLFRQMHSWGATFIVLVLIFHLLKVLWYGAYKRPREFTWFAGVLLLLVTLGFCFTGYILPWNQLAKWATAVGTDTINKVPWIGPSLHRLVCGGRDVSGETLGRFFAVHVFLLPVSLTALAIIHLALVRLKGITPKVTVAEELAGGYDRALESTGAEPFFPRQVYRDAILCILGFAALVTVATYFPFELGEPASNATPVGIKPEWYFLPVYQFLKYFDDTLIEQLPFLARLHLDAEFVGILFVNTCIAMFFLLPVLDRGKHRKIRRRPFFTLLALTAILGTLGLGILGYVSGRSFTFGGKIYTFPIKGYPPEIKEATPAGAPEGQGAELVQGEKEAGAPKGTAADPPARRADGRPLAGSCGACHEHEKERKKWIESIHARIDPPVQCADCHKGNDQTDDEEAAHAGLLTDQKGEWRKPKGEEIIAICGRCHFEVKERFSKDHLALSPSKTCFNCHSNHKVEEAGVWIFEKAGYQDPQDPRAARFKEIGLLVKGWEEEGGKLEQEIGSARKFLEEREFPMAAFAETELKVKEAERGIAAATHTLAAGEVETALKGGREALGELKGALAAEIVAIDNRKVLVAATWVVSLFFTLLLASRLRRLRREEREQEILAGKTTEVLHPKTAEELLRELDKP